MLNRHQPSMGPQGTGSIPRTLWSKARTANGISADTRLVSCLPDDDVEFGDEVEFKSAYPERGYVHDRVIVKHVRSAESDLPVIPIEPFGAG